MIQQRPRFRLGEKFVPDLIQEHTLPRKIRKRDPDGRVMRPAFKVRGPTPRRSKTISEIQELRTKQHGIKVRLGDSKVGKVKVKKRDADGNVIKDDQGNIVYEERAFNLNLLGELLEGSSESNLEKLEMLKNLIDSGAVESKSNQDDLTAILISILTNTGDLKDMSTTQLGIITRALDLLPVSNDPRSIGIPLISDRFITGKTMFGGEGLNIGLVLMFLIANSKNNPSLSPSNPIFGIRGNPISIRSFLTNTRQNYIIDLMELRIYRNINAASEATGIVPKYEEEGEREEEKKFTITEEKEEREEKIPEGEALPALLRQQEQDKDDEAEDAQKGLLSRMKEFLKIGET